MKGFLLFFDNRFLRILISKPKDKHRERWQEFFFEKINREFLPFTILTTPFKFLEVIGVRPNVRSIASYPFEKLDTKLGLPAVAEEVAHLNGKILEDAIDFYSHRPELRLSYLEEQIEYLFENKIGKSQFHQVLARDIITRFANLDGLEELIWSYLAVDDLQGVLLRASDDTAFYTAQMQTLKDVLAIIAEGQNISCFRLLRSIWCSIEGQVLNRGFKSIVPLKKESDLADVDYVHYATVGGYHKDKLRTMSIFTCDDIGTVTNRLKICKQLFGLYAYDILSKPLQRDGYKLPQCRYGRVFVCDPIKPVCEVVRVKKLSDQYELPEGALNPKMVERISGLKC